MQPAYGHTQNQIEEIIKQLRENLKQEYLKPKIDVNAINSISLQIKEYSNILKKLKN